MMQNLLFSYTMSISITKLHVMENNINKKKMVKNAKKKKWKFIYIQYILICYRDRSYVILAE